MMRESIDGRIKGALGCDERDIQEEQDGRERTLGGITR